MKRLLTITIAVALCAVTPVYGHIGWTLDQCRQYYGQETGIVMGAYEFANAGGAFSIYVRFLEGKVAL